MKEVNSEYEQKEFTRKNPYIKQDDLDHIKVSADDLSLKYGINKIEGGLRWQLET